MTSSRLIRFPLEPVVFPLCFPIHCQAMFGELYRFVERLVALANRRELTSEMVKHFIRYESTDTHLVRDERTQLLKALVQMNWNRTHAAKLMGIDSLTVHRKLY